jgi:serine/threonine protein kinase
VVQVKDFHERFPAGKQPHDPKVMATELVRAGKLTKYQAIALFQGKPKLLSFGEYLILEKLGQGGMGQVMKAEHRRMKRVVAIKIISPEALSNENAVRRFETEVHAAARLIHPNIVTAFDANEHEGVHYYVMEFVDGLDLKALSKTHGPLPLAMALDYVVQTARGLAYAHGKGIIHRDIKPANLLVDREGTVKILDMGLALMDRDEDTPQLTTEGQVLGTVDFMAPEQAIDTHAADARADIYSLGCTFYRLLTGEALYSGETTMRKLMSHREDPIPSLTAKRSDVPAAIEEVWVKMVAKLPEDRQQTMAEVVTALEICMYGRPHTSFKPEGGGSVSYGSQEFLPVLTSAADNAAASNYSDDGLTTATVVETRTKQMTRASDVTTNMESGETDPDTMVSVRVETAPPAPKSTSPAPGSSAAPLPPLPAKGNRAFIAIAAAGIVVAVLLIAALVALNSGAPTKPADGANSPATASPATAAPSP